MTQQHKGDIRAYCQKCGTEVPVAPFGDYYLTTQVCEKCRDEIITNQLK